MTDELINVFDTNTVSPYVNDVQTNIVTILSTYKSDDCSFIIKNGDIILPAQIYHVYNSSYYGIRYPIKERIISLLPFDIIFADFCTSEKGNDCHINSIHKFMNLSGTQIVETLIKFLKLINVHRISLTDGAIINYSKINNKHIKIDLSLFKLIEKGETFYQRFGFVAGYRSVYHKSIFEQNGGVDNALKKYLKNINSLKCSELKSMYDKLIKILQTVITTNDYNNVKLYKWDTFIKSVNNSTHIYDSVNNMKKCIKLHKQFISFIYLLDNEKYFKDLLLNTFNDDKRAYVVLEKNILKYSDIIGIEYGGEKVMLDFLDDFLMLNIIKNMLYVLDLRSH
ncbi:MAG: hypothetical protein Homavirus7_8 [Homavirus sp.]|uniref:Uncharacterized protein n=1 Tax=Homavirus sp. TaxID=2487769 RepID=A0A3G5A4T9_9VIRU|nr:MAG: hypothetical protein Homavirus7_8 [Homavirus sp.]